MTTYSRDEIDAFIERHLGQAVPRPSSNLDIFDKFGVDGDDCFDFISEFGTTFKVDLTEYRWYFHHGEEMHNGVIFQIFFSPPNKRVSRIPVTTDLLLDAANSGRWKLEYPEHALPTRRYDVIASWCFGLALIVGIAALGVIRWSS